MRKLKAYSFEQAIPRNLLHDEKVRNLAHSLEKPIKEVTEWSEKLNYTQNVEDLPEAIIDHLLWEKHITWNEGLALATTREQKINLLNSAIDLHRTKGTPAAIENVLKTLNLSGEVIEWFQYGGNPYHFKVEIELIKIKGNTLDLLHTLINTYKNIRSWLQDISIRFPQQQLNLSELQYHYPVYYPISGYHWTEGTPGLALENTMRIASDTFAYPIYYPTALQGVPGAPSQAQATLQSHAAAQTNPYPVCGMFYGGGF